MQTKDVPRASGIVLLYVAGAVAAAIMLSLVVAAGLFTSGLLGSLAPATTPPATTSPHDNRLQYWRLVDRSELGFQVDLPGEPTSQQRTTAKGIPLNVFHIRTDDGMFMIFANSTSSVGPPPKQFINELQARAYTDGEQFLYAQFVDVPGAEACKELHFVDHYDELTMLRFVVTKNAFYQVVWSGSPDDRDSPAARRFLDSFSIVN